MTEKDRLELQPEQLDFAKRAFRYKELAQDMPSVDEEWEKFTEEHAAELDALEDGVATKTGGNTPPLYQLRKMAAAFVGFLFIAGIAFATIQWIASPSPSKGGDAYIDNEQKARHLSSNQASSPLEGLGEATPVIFNDVTLDVMLTEIAKAHHATVEFQNEQPRQLRFYFVWKREDSLEQVVKKLNNFEAVNITLENQTLTVR